MTALKMGVAGAGVFGSYHASKIAALDGVDFTGVYDVDAERAQALAQKNQTRAFSDYRALLDESHAIVIATPAVNHFDLGDAALCAGKHVFVEKPLAATAPAARALAERAAAAGLVLQVGHQERYVCDAIGLFNRDKIPQRIECVRHVPFTGRCGDVSAVLDLMVHDLDLVARLTNNAVALNISADGHQNAVSAEIFLASGTLATLSARRGAADSERRITIIYDDGAIEFDFIRRDLKNSTPAALSARFDAGETPLAFRDPLALGAELFANGVKSGKTLGVSGAEAAAIVEWAQKIEQSAGIETVRDADLLRRVRR